MTGLCYGLAVIAAAGLILYLIVTTAQELRDEEKEKK